MLLDLMVKLLQYRMLLSISSMQALGKLTKHQFQFNVSTLAMLDKEKAEISMAGKRE